MLYLLCAAFAAGTIFSTTEPFQYWPFVLKSFARDESRQVGWKPLMVGSSMRTAFAGVSSHGGASGEHQVGTKHSLHGRWLQVSDFTLQALLAVALSLRPYDR